MEKIYNSITELIGSTPLIRVHRLNKEEKAEILVKTEAFNPGGSVKDRIAYQMIMEAKKAGRLDKDTVLIEPTSGNTGIGLAMTAAALGIRLMIVLPETMSVERRKMIRAYGAELILTEGSKGMTGAIAKAEELHKEIPNSIILQQFENADNPNAHYLHTGEEIWRDTDGKLDVFVAGVGTGGTISGVAAYLKEKNADIVILEVGLGGSGDSTNVVKEPLASVICSISYDHMDRLGNTLEEIAADKAGIIKPGCPVISNVPEHGSAAVIARRAYENDSRLYDVSGIKFHIIR